MEKDRQVVHKLKVISVVSFIFMTVEIMGGIMANSIAILADAFHLLSDVLAYIISLQAVLMSHRKPPFYMTFGYEKIQPLGALVNIAIIWFVTLELVVEATERIINKSVVEDPFYMLLTSFFGLGCNLYIMKVLHGDVEHGGHQGCSHAHGLQHHHDHEHNSKEHKHKPGEKCSHGHSHKKQKKTQKARVHGKKCNHAHGHHQEHNHDHASSHNHNHDHDHGHDHNHEQHHDDHHDHDHNHQQHKHQHHEHSATCSHNKVVTQDSSDSFRQINSFDCQKQGGPETYSPLALSQQHLNQQGSLQAHISYKAQPTEQQQLSQQSMNIALKQKARKQLFANINIQAAYIHIISDIILSIGVIISALIIFFNADREQWTYWQLADPFCTYLFSIMAIYSTIGVAKDSIVILLDGCDDANMLKEIIGELDAMDEIQSYNELRVWSLNRAKFAAAVKIHLTKEKFQNRQLRDIIRDRVTALFSVRGISHYVQISEQPLKQLKSE